MNPRLYSQEPRGDNTPNSLRCKLYTIRRLELDPSLWANLEVCSPFWRLYLHDGPGSSISYATQVQQKEQSIKHLHFEAGKLYIIPSGLPFKTHVETNNIVQSYTHFDWVGLSPDMSKNIFTQPYEIPSQPFSQWFCQWFSETPLPSNENPDEKPNLSAMSKLKAMLHFALAEWHDQMPSHRQELLKRHLQGHHEMRPIIDYIEKHLGATIHNQDLAKRCHLSVDHFIRQFRSWTQQTPAQYILDCRVKKAAEALLYSSDSIESIAERYGFSDRFHLSRTFKSRLGQSPAKYRRQQAL